MQRPTTDGQVLRLCRLPQPFLLVVVKRQVVSRKVHTGTEQARRGQGCYFKHERRFCPDNHGNDIALSGLCFLLTAPVPGAGTPGWLYSALSGLNRGTTLFCCRPFYVTRTAIGTTSKLALRCSWNFLPFFHRHFSLS